MTCTVIHLDRRALLRRLDPPAGTLLSVLPVIVLFVLLQKEFVAGLTAGAVKG
jgi:hypothetical protein